MSKESKPLRLFIAHGTGIPDEACVEFFKDTNITVLTRDNKRYLHGIEIKEDL